MKHRGLILFLVGMAGALAGGWLAFPKALYRTEPQPFLFNHKAHAEKSGMPCADCHGFRDDGSFVGIAGRESCAACHAEPAGTTQAEKTMVERYIKPGIEIPWKVYSRQPVNARFSHARHVQVAKLECKECHGNHGESSALPPYQVNRISGYSRDIWGRKMLRVNRQPGDGMKMDDCEGCHARNGVEAGCLGCHR